MSKYTTFDNESKRRSLKLCKLFNGHREDQRYQISKMPKSYSCSPYCSITDFNQRTKFVCQNTDLSMKFFLDACKVIFVGDSNSGKTSLINRFTASTFDHDYKPTLGVDYETKYFDVLNVSFNVGFWDLPGVPSFKLMVQPYLTNANGNLVHHQINMHVT